MAAPKTLDEKLSMPHLRPTEELKAEAEEAVNGKRAEPADPRANREYPFQFKWTDSAGKTWSGPFVSKILTLGEQSLVGTLRARLSGSVAYEALDDFTKELNYLVANLSYSLKDRPEWAKDLRELDDIALLQALFAEVAKHEATFRGQRKTEVGSKEGG